MLIERKTLYDPRVHSHNIPQCRTIYYAPEKQAKEFCTGREPEQDRELTEPCSGAPGAALRRAGGPPVGSQR